MYMRHIINRILLTATGVPYNVSIVAVSRVGPGEFTVFIHFTRELVPSIAPKNVTISRPSPTVMVVSWIPLTYSEARGFISHYTVAYTPFRVDGHSLQTLTQTVTDINSARIEGLDPTINYIFLVSVTNGAGRNELSHPILETSEGAVSQCNINFMHKYIHTAVADGTRGLVTGIVVVVVIAVLVIAMMSAAFVILLLKLKK